VAQATRVALLVLLVWGILHIWFDDSGRLGTVAGLATAGIAVALQRVITSFAAYLIVLRGRVYTVGDRITLGGVRGDVVRVGFMQTAVMEMGEPANAQTGDPKVWITARQYTGRLVSVTNDRIFETPVYNYTREFPFLWEELAIPIKYGADRGRAEEILLGVARRHTAAVIESATPALAALKSRYLIPDDASLEPRTYLRLTDNWVELTLRFVGPVRGIRALKDAMSRDVLAALEAAGLEIASATYEIVGLPPIAIVEHRTTAT
jgi:small-conductance mechanosensitive channel